MTRLSSRVAAAALEGALISLLVIGLIAVPAFAAKGGGSGNTASSALTLVLLDSTDGSAHYSQHVTFTINSSTAKPDVNVRCNQGTTMVYDAWVGYYPEAWGDRDFTLSSWSWTGGGADCTARLVSWGKNGRERTLGSLNFAVLP